jgi:hypothetical protein
MDHDDDEIAGFRKTYGQPPPAELRTVDDDDQARAPPPDGRSAPLDDDAAARELHRRGSAGVNEIIKQRGGFEPPSVESAREHGRRSLPNDNGRPWSLSTPTGAYALIQTRRGRAQQHLAASAHAKQRRASHVPGQAAGGGGGGAEALMLAAREASVAAERTGLKFAEEFGVGVALYFKYQKLLIGLFLTMSILTLPNLLLCMLGGRLGGGDGSLAAFVERTTLANVPSSPIACVVVNASRCRVSFQTVNRRSSVERRRSAAGQPVEQTKNRARGVLLRQVHRQRVVVPQQRVERDGRRGGR